VAPARASYNPNTVMWSVSDDAFADPTVARLWVGSDIRKNWVDSYPPALLGRLLGDQMPIAHAPISLSSAAAVAKDLLIVEVPYCGPRGCAGAAEDLVGMFMCGAREGARVPTYHPVGAAKGPA
jgi:hypothetical protein